MLATSGIHKADTCAKRACAPTAIGLLLIACATAAAPPSLPCRYEIAVVVEGPFCPGWGVSRLFARGLSNHGPPWVAGFYSECQVGPEKAFVWTGAGSMQTLTFPPGTGTYSYAYDVTDTGWVVGTFSTSGGWRGFIHDLTSGEFTQLDPGVAGGGVVIRAANNHGAAATPIPAGTVRSSGTTASSLTWAR